MASKLDSPDVQRAYLDAVEAGADADGAARAIGMTRQHVGRYLRATAEFAERVETAKARYKASRRALSREVAQLRPPTPDGQRAIADRVGVPVRLVEDADAVGGPTVEQIISTAWEGANNPDEHPAVRATLWRGLWEYKLGPLVEAERRRAQREADREAAALERESASDGDGPLVIALPSNGTHAPRRPRQVVDAEVVE